METYFKLKLFFAIIPITLSALILILLLICFMASEIKAKRIENFFLSHGYARKLLGVPRFGNGTFYGWIRECDHKVVDDRYIKHMSLREIKEKYE